MPDHPSRHWLPVAAVVVMFAALTLLVGSRTVDADPADGLSSVPGRGSMGITTGPDVTVYDIRSLNHYGSTGTIHGYSIGTDSCNIGSEPLNWCDDPPGNCTNGMINLNDEQHPVIAQNLYRLRGGRFEQIGMSWLKHGFLSTNSFAADCLGNDGAGNPTTCTTPPLFGDQLGIGCTDFYGATLNGGQPLGARSEVNPTTALFPFPEVLVGVGGTIGQRIQVEESDMNGAGDRFWMEAHYVADNDALFGNGLNNASHREVSINSGSFDINYIAPTVRELSAIFAWQAIDPMVEIVNAESASSVKERFEAARRVTDLGAGQWHYEVAIHNMNSDRSARSFMVDFAAATTITNIGFHDVDHHSGEPYATTDWTSVVNGGAGTVTWSTDDFATDPNANALRWGTMFTFWFDADRGPESATHTLGLFKPGSPTEVNVPFAGGGPSISIFFDGFESGDTLAWSDTQQ